MMNLKNKTYRYALLMGAFMLAVTPLQAQDTTVDEDTVSTTVVSGSLIEVLQARGNFTTLLKALDTAGLTEDLQGEGRFTLFAPTDEAFAELEEGAVEDLLKPVNRAQLVQLLRFHVIEGNRFEASDLQARASELSYELQTMGGLIAISSAETGVYIGGATIATPDISAGNGIIHVMSSVITPPNMNDMVDNN